MRVIDPARGYELDTSFIQQEHHTNPRRLYSTTGADWQYRVDHERLRRQRLERARAEMEADDLGALVFFAGANIRYITGSYQGNWKYNINIRYAVLPRGGDPVLFETAGSDMRNAMLDLPWMKDRIQPAMTWQWAEGAVGEMADKMTRSIYEVLKDHGVEKEKIGVDNLDLPALHAMEKAGIKVVNGWPAISRARVVKTVDEIEHLKMASSIGDAAMWHVKHEWLKPGISERQI
ncbi:MAG: aminopeptidase P family N-terminal domain-containing protein, partial [Rhizobiales bacterium]|nr:aminopeptidase P family N-terminal domain-containing protein [Hyphomicrobiales bacterium]